MNHQEGLGNLGKFQLASEGVIISVIWLHGPVVAVAAWLAGRSLLLGLSLWLATAVGATWTHCAQPGADATRATVAAALCVMPALIVLALAATTWQADAHMLFFAELAVTAALLDVRAIIAGALVVAIHHLALNLLLPALVFPGGADLSRVLFHAVVLALECTALAWLVNKTARAIVEAEASLVNSLTDPLTGLPNRRAFMNQAQRVLDRQSRNGQPVALLAFDLDRFKSINDTFGHAMGDRVLCIFADLLSTSLRPTNIIARIGGEEFVAIVGDTDGEAAVAIANRVREALEKAAQFVDDQRIGATVSVGVAAIASQNTTVLDMMREADSALYRAKNEGRNRVALAPIAAARQSGDAGTQHHHHRDRAALSAGL